MKPSNQKPTDWDQYYKKTVSSAKFTRKISENKIVKLMQDHQIGLEVPPEIAELGGANSCFIDGILERVNPLQYDAYDNNNYGLNLLSEKFSDSNRVGACLENALNLTQVAKRYDIVFSVGLIEHFDEQNTRKCIESHFEICKPGGIVLITFPHPTILYRFIRYVAEITKNWDFPDERPLSFEEVLGTACQDGEVIHKSINWMIGLTQGYIVCRKK